MNAFRLIFQKLSLVIISASLFTPFNHLTAFHSPHPQENEAMLQIIEEQKQDPLSIISCSLIPTKYEEVLLTILRDRETEMKEFRFATKHIAEILVSKVVECLKISPKIIATPITPHLGLELSQNVELVSIMRSGDALLTTFINHFPKANVSKILVQRDEETAIAHFKYMKLSPSIADGSAVVITEPMIGTGGTLELVINQLKATGVQEENIIIASVLAAPEGIQFLSEKFPNIRVVLTILDDCLNERKYIIPGLGDFGDRYFGTPH